MLNQFSVTVRRRFGGEQARECGRREGDIQMAAARRLANGADG